MMANPILIVSSDSSGWAPGKLDNTNWNAWSTEAIRVIKLLRCMHYIGMNGGVQQKSNELLYSHPENYLFLLSKNILIGSKYPFIIKIKF